MQSVTSRGYERSIDFSLNESETSTLRQLRHQFDLSNTHGGRTPTMPQWQTLPKKHNKRWRHSSCDCSFPTLTAKAPSVERDRS